MAARSRPAPRNSAPCSPCSCSGGTRSSLPGCLLTRSGHASPPAHRGQDHSGLRLAIAEVHSVWECLKPTSAGTCSRPHQTMWTRIIRDRSWTRSRRAHRRTSRTAAGLLRQALALWRGTALAEFQFEGWACRRARSAARAARCSPSSPAFEADVAPRVTTAAAIPELQRWSASTRCASRCAGHSCSRCTRWVGRRDALAVYTKTRDELVEELGVDPTESLRRLQADILRHDPALEPTEAARVRARPHPPTPTPTPSPTPSSPTPAPRPSPTPAHLRRPAGFGKRRRRWVRRPLTTAACVTLVAITALGLSNAQGPSTV